MKSQNTVPNCACNICRKQIRLIACHLKKGIYLSRKGSRMYDKFWLCFLPNQFYVFNNSYLLSYMGHVTTFYHPIFPFRRRIKDCKDLQTPETIAGSQRICLKIEGESNRKVLVTQSNQTASNVTLPHKRLCYDKKLHQYPKRQSFAKNTHENTFPVCH